MKYKKKLIEVALPLEAINIASAREKSIRQGHPSTMHLWWARRPLAAARAVIFSQMVDDPSEHPEIFPTEKSQEKERQRLFKIIEDLVQWENTNNEQVLDRARQEIFQSWRYTCAENADSVNAKELFDRYTLPGFHDPFSGGGSLPLEGQRLGLESNASDLNPVAVLLNKGMIEIPHKFANLKPVNLVENNTNDLTGQKWIGIKGMVDDLIYYGKWLRDEAENRIGGLYPKIAITSEIAKLRPELAKYVGGPELTVIAWIWARTVKSPNPAFSNIDVPLASTFVLSTKPGKVSYVQPVIEGDSYKFEVRTGASKDFDKAKNGTKLSRGANFKCLMSDTPMPDSYVRGEFQNKRSGVKLMAVVLEGARERVYLSPSIDQESLANSIAPEWIPEQEMSQESSNLVSGRGYGITHWHEIFTMRQLKALTTFYDLVKEVSQKIKDDALASGIELGKSLDQGGCGALAYSESIRLYLTFSIDKCAVYWNSLCPWLNQAKNEIVGNAFGRQALPMVWDFAESNPLSDSGANITKQIDYVAKALAYSAASKFKGTAFQADAQTQSISKNKVISTDPPYYDNIAYADLSDFFYIWQRYALKDVFPNLFSTMSVPKAEELVATAFRHGGREKAEQFFLGGMTLAMHRLAEQAHPAFPVTIYYAFKQAESSDESGTINTGWDTFLAAIIEAGFSISGTWPMRTERDGRMIGNGKNSLASSIVLVCRKHANIAPTTTLREFIAALKKELPPALSHLQESNIAPVDLAQAAIGPGMSVFTRFSKVLDAQGNAISVRTALSLINQTLDEALAKQDGDFDSDSRWALTWFDQKGFDEGDYGVAEQLSVARNTSVEGLENGGIVSTKLGKVRLLKPFELDENWDPKSDKRLTAWEVLHQLIKALESGGETVAAKLVAKLGSESDIARELCYRLYTLCERKKRTNEAMSYNGLVQSWPEIVRLASETSPASKSGTQDLFDQE